MSASPVLPNGRILRYSFHERLVHWLAAVSYIYLLLTGLAFWSPWLFWLAILFGGGTVSRELHPWAGLVFVAATLMMFAMWGKQMRETQSDKEFWRSVSHYIRNEDELVPSADRFNAGQKILFWGFFLVWNPPAAVWPDFVVSPPDSLEPSLPPVFRRDRPSRSRPAHDWAVHHSRLYGHRNGTGRFRLGDSRRRLDRLGQKVSSPLVRTLDARAALAMNVTKWDARIERANQLAAAYPSASEGLHFYERLTRFHRTLYSQIEVACGASKRARPMAMLRQEFDAFLLLPHFAPFLSLVVEIAPAPLAQFARKLRARGGSDWQQMLLRFWQDGSGAPANSDPFETVLSWLFLQPYAEYLADHTDSKPPLGTPSICPVCGGKPAVAVLRPEGDGAKRTLICALCATEWNYRRIVCPRVVKKM